MMAQNISTDPLFMVTEAKKSNFFAPPPLQNFSCTDLEIFVRGGPTLTKFFSFIFSVRQHRPASETPFKWRFAGVPMMDGLVAL